MDSSAEYDPSKFFLLSCFPPDMVRPLSKVSFLAGDILMISFLEKQVNFVIHSYDYVRHAAVSVTFFLTVSITKTTMLISSGSQ